MDARRCRLPTRLTVFDRSLSQSLSLSQELSSAHGRKTSFSSNGSTTSPLSASPRSRPNLSISMPTLGNEQRTVSSMEKEIMRLQEVLKDREAEIAALEVTVKEQHVLTQSPAIHKPPVPSLSLPQTPELVDSTRLNGLASPPHLITPNTLTHFEGLRKALGNGHADTDGSSSVGTIDEADENLDRLNELMR
jgi:hypothetical protein